MRACAPIFACAHVCFRALDDRWGPWVGIFFPVFLRSRQSLSSWFSGDSPHPSHDPVMLPPRPLTGAPTDGPVCQSPPLLSLLLFRLQVDPGARIHLLLPRRGPKPCAWKAPVNGRAPADCRAPQTLESSRLLGFGRSPRALHIRATSQIWLLRLVREHGLKSQQIALDFGHGCHGFASPDRTPPLVIRTLLCTTFCLSTASHGFHRDHRGGRTAPRELLRHGAGLCASDEELEPPLLENGA